MNDFSQDLIEGITIAAANYKPNRLPEEIVKLDADFLQKMTRSLIGFVLKVNSQVSSEESMYFSQRYQALIESLNVSSRDKHLMTLFIGLGGCASSLFRYFQVAKIDFERLANLASEQVQTLLKKEDS